MKWGEQYTQKPVAMSIAEANLILGGPHSSEEAIRSAYAKALREVHPDTAKDEISSAGAQIGRIKLARDILLDGLNQVQETPCKMCGGSGRVGVGFGVPCTACHGKGVQ